MDDLRKKRTLDFPLFLSALTLWIIGIFLVYSATHFLETGILAGIYRQQIMWVILALLIIVFIVSIPCRFIFRASYAIYGLSLLLLVMVVAAGVVTKGAERWIAIGGFRIQPSEFAKIGLLLALARYLSENSVSLYKPSTFIIPVIMIFVPFALVLQQPDLSTALVFCAMTLPMFYWSKLALLDVFYIISPMISMIMAAIPLLMAYNSGESWGAFEALPWGLFFLVVITALYFARAPIFLWVGVIAANIATGIVVTVLWGSVLKDYQKMRIISFMNPQVDPFGAGYQVIQSQVAIGSGHVFGKGFLQGTQTRLSFLPEQHTDFIFSVLGEQFGLVGCSIVILLFMFLIMRSLMLTRECRNRYINLLAVGISAILCFHVFVNIAITIGIMPVTGLPLPFLSYGGSFTVTVAVLIGLLLNAKVTDQDF
ncbi:MAG: rod shape-determining protein RodA [Chitinispirillales bacterium]|jgi:rod shape determining protein RodA|nr:rod shape-determining protein RodA [Chitinispirillales bacterium]